MLPSLTFPVLGFLVLLSPRRCVVCPGRYHQQPRGPGVARRGTPTDGSSQWARRQPASDRSVHAVAGDLSRSVFTPRPIALVATLIRVFDIRRSMIYG